MARAEDGDLADWGRTEHNLAELVDTLSAYLHYQWSNWTTDPDDPEFQREHKRRRAAGIKPPPVPLIPPVAARPARLAEARLAAFEQLAQSARLPGHEQPVVDEPLMSLDAWEAALSL